MKVFKDAIGREWSIVVNVGTAKVVRDLTTVDIFNIYQDEAARVFGDPAVFVNVLYSFCKKQADERKIGEEEFFAGMTGDSLEVAANALLEEVANFFPASRRTVMQKMHSKMIELEALTAGKAMEAIDKIDVATISSMTPTK